MHIYLLLAICKSAVFKQFVRRCACIGMEAYMLHPNNMVVPDKFISTYCVITWYAVIVCSFFLWKRKWCTLMLWWCQHFMTAWYEKGVMEWKITHRVDYNYDGKSYPQEHNAKNYVDLSTARKMQYSFGIWFYIHHRSETELLSVCE